MKKRTAKKTVSGIKTKAVEAAEKVVESVPEIVETVSEKTEEFMNSPMVEEGKEIFKETAEKVSATVCTKISEVTIELFDTSVSVKELEKAVKKDASDKKLKGDIKIYINTAERVAYYTVNEDTENGGKIDLTNL